MENDVRPSFNTNYKVVQQLVRTDGGLMLPEDYKERLYLAGWLLDLKEGLTLTGREQEKIAEVMDHFEKTKRDAKFDWIWYGRLDRLLRYKREYHTFTVTKSDNKHKKLRAWVIRQREMEKDNKLAEQRKKMLMNVGFDFSHRFASRKRKYTSEQENAWNEMYNKLVDFREKIGHCNVCFYDKTNPKLAIWVNTQRSTYKEGKMTSERKNRLESLGFVWRIRSVDLHVPDTDGHVKGE